MSNIEINIDVCLINSACSFECQSASLTLVIFKEIHILYIIISCSSTSVGVDKTGLGKFWVCHKKCLWGDGGSKQRKILTWLQNVLF